LKNECFLREYLGGYKGLPRAKGVLRAFPDLEDRHLLSPTRQQCTSQETYLAFQEKLPLLLDQNL